jgi:hypothetical protein
LFSAWWPGGDDAIVSLHPGNDRSQGTAWRIAVGGTARRDSLLGKGWVIGDVSPDSTWFAVRRYGDSAAVWLVSRDGERRDLLAPNSGWPVFSPDGRWVAFVGLGGLRVAAVPFSGTMQTVGPESADEPEWSPRGDELYYRDGKRWMAMTVTTAGGLTVGNPRLLIEGPYLNVRSKSYDVGPDGRFLLLLGPPGETAPHLSVVTGFAAELRRLAPPAGK